MLVGYCTSIPWAVVRSKSWKTGLLEEVLDSCYISCKRSVEHNLDKIEDSDTVGFANMHVLPASSMYFVNEPIYLYHLSK